MSEFKGSKGKWIKKQTPCGDIEISAKGFQKLAIVKFYPDDFLKLYNNSFSRSDSVFQHERYRKEAVYNCKLIATAPDLLEFLFKIKKQWEEDDLKYGGENYNLEYLNNLIKKATL